MIDALARSDFSGFDRRQVQTLEGIAARLKQAKRPVLIGGGDLLGPRGTDCLMNCSRQLSSKRSSVTATAVPLHRLSASTTAR